MRHHTRPHIAETLLRFGCCATAVCTRACGRISSQVNCSKPTLISKYIEPSYSTAGGMQVAANERQLAGVELYEVQEQLDAKQVHVRRR